MQTDNVDRFAAMLTAGFEAVGCRIPVAREESCVVVRDILVEVGPTIACFRASDAAEPFMSFPGEAMEAAASSVCMSVLSGIVTRAIETS